ncbi:MAG: TRAP transporter TatT component family protein [Leptothrix sp. (in: b-proteobacteria)]
MAWRSALRYTCLITVLGLLCACSPRMLIVQGMADELASQAQASEDDLVLAREASAFYLKLSESVLRQSPEHLKLAEAVAGGFTQYSFAFIAFDAERIEAKDSKAAQLLRERAARLYQRAQRHAMAALERHTPGFTQALRSSNPANWPQLDKTQIGLAYWAAAAWGGQISLSKDDPDIVADLPLAIRLAKLAWEKMPDYGEGALASLMGSFEAARPGGSRAQALVYFDRAIILGAGKQAGALVGKAENIALPAGDRVAFDALLRQALAISQNQHNLQNEVMRARAQWLLDTADDIF